MNVELAWEQDIIGRGVVVSILDDGLEYTHPDLRDNYVSLYGIHVISFSGSSMKNYLSTKVCF